MLRQTKTENGLVRGFPGNNPIITVYKGIPFAAPPVGRNRWRVPQPAENWEGVRDCFSFAPAAPQQIPGKDFNNMYIREFWVDPDFAQGEDCLYLNVWTPANSVEDKLPVMVWIYGGGMQCGYTSEMEFNGENIAKRGVILVSIPYRVTAFGYLAHPELTAEAKANGEGCTNFGLYDQRFALEWIKRNIANFGGDPDNITIFGQSAGGRSVLFQAMTPLAKEGDFHRLITQSGGGIPSSAAYGYPSLEEAEQIGVKFFEYLGVKTLDEARTLDTETVRHAAVTFTEGRFGVSIDGSFVPDHPATLLAENRRLQVPIMCGHTTGDMTHPIPAKTAEEFAEYIKVNYPEAADEILKLVGTELDGMKAAVEINGQRQGNELLAMRAADAGLDAYFYAFGGDMPGDDNADSFHSSELWFVFETLAMCWRPFVGRHYDLARQMCNYWTNFAKTGDPNGIDVTGEPMPRWEKFTNDKPYSMNFGPTPVMGAEKEKPAVQLMLNSTADKLWRK